MKGLGDAINDKMELERTVTELIVACHTFSELVGRRILEGAEWPFEDLALLEDHRRGVQDVQLRLVKDFRKHVPCTHPIK